MCLLGKGWVRSTGCKGLSSGFVVKDALWRWREQECGWLSPGPVPTASYSKQTIMAQWNRRSHIAHFPETMGIAQELRMLQNCQRGLERRERWWELMFGWEEIQFRQEMWRRPDNEKGMERKYIFTPVLFDLWKVCLAREVESWLGSGLEWQAEERNKLCLMPSIPRNQGNPAAAMK